MILNLIRLLPLNLPLKNSTNSFFGLSISALLPCLVIAITSTSSVAENLKSVPFWAAQQGHWLSENTYMDGQYNSKIAHYGTLFSIDVGQNKAIITERKFYPPGHFPASAVGLEIPDSMGVQLIQVSKAQSENSQQHPGSVIFAPLNAYMATTEDKLQPVTESSALYTSINKESKQPTYQMLITLPNPNTRIVVNLGLNKAEDVYELGPLRGVSVFSAVRIQATEIEKQQQVLRERYNTGVVVTTDEKGKFMTKWL
ncbi:MAG: hypothetical protein ABJV04_20265 [Aliiglaciecola sp.]|uniref:hypothetical protein n=1 Tax=Aliiglaciecola sp. TaxID=1872441 RepID=UPI003296A4ED